MYTRTPCYETTPCNTSCILQTYKLFLAHYQKLLYNNSLQIHILEYFFRLLYWVIIRTLTTKASALQEVYLLAKIEYNSTVLTNK